MALPFDLGPWQAVWLVLALLAAAFVRGYSGFGFAALLVSGAALVMDPLRLVPMVLVVDAAMTLQQARGIRRDIDWRRVAGLLGGAAVGVPLGLWGLSLISVDAARAVFSAYVLGMCGALLAGWRLARPPGIAAHLAVGLVSGLANAAAVGGLPVAAFFAAQPIGAAAFRATLIAYFTLLDLWSLALMARAGMISTQTLWAGALSLPVLALGIWLGGRHFLRAAPQGFRRFATLLLAGLAGLGLLKSLW